jgi:purine-binding chemotaxis protein CheW
MNPRRADDQPARLRDRRERGERRRVDLHVKSVDVKHGAEQMYVCFMVGEERYLLDILRVKEVARIQKMTRMPQSTPGMAGVIDLRGTFVPILDLRSRLGLISRPSGRLSRIIVVITQGRFAGLLVDQLLPVIRVSISEVQPAPRLAGEPGYEFLTGMCARGEEVYLLIDLERLLELPANVVRVPEGDADATGQGKADGPVSITQSRE